MEPHAAHTRRALVYGLYCLSGLVSLIYQVAWFRIFVDRFGSTTLTFVRWSVGAPRPGSRPGSARRSDCGCTESWSFASPRARCSP